MGDILVVHFEDVITDRDTQLRFFGCSYCSSYQCLYSPFDRRILHFLKLTPDERRLECVLHGKFDIYKVSRSCRIIFFLKQV